MPVVRLVRGPLDAGRTARLIAALAEQSTPATWLTPTRRTADEARRVLARQPGLLPWIGDLLHFADAIVSRQAGEARPLSGVQRRLILESILDQAEADRELRMYARVRHTRGFRDALLEQFEQLRQAAIDPAVLKRKAAEERTVVIAGLYVRYCAALRNQNRLDAAERLRRAAKLLREGSPLPIGPTGRLFVNGFHRFTRPEVELLHVLAGVGAELWISLPGELTEHRAELFEFAATTAADFAVLAPTTDWADRDPIADRPAGLRRLAEQLFHRSRDTTPGNDASGLECIQAPGPIGEARSVARRIKRLLLDGVSADQVIVVCRDLDARVDELREIFDDYGIPLDLEGTEPIARRPAVAALLRALRLVEDDWPFAGTTALLRHTCFRPAWASQHEGIELALQADSLLRHLNMARGKRAILDTVERWARRPDQGLEDEDILERQRQQIHRLAQQCLPFLRRFFQAWDACPDEAALAEHVAAVHRLADTLGITASANDAPREQAALARLFEELQVWLDRERRGGRGKGPRLTRAAFFDRLDALAETAALARTPRGPGRVRVLSAEQAARLAVDHLFLIGMGEGSYPRLGTPAVALDAASRQALGKRGLHIPPPPADTLASERLLFHQLVTAARRQLVLSYPATDAKGQELYPATFLKHVIGLFAKEVIPTERREMLIQGLDADPPLSLAEHRLQSTRDRTFHPSAELPVNVAENLRAAQLLQVARFKADDFTPFDGRFRSAAAIAAAAEQFGPRKVFSPTTLEDYIACPFRFFLKNVLRLEPLDDPSEEIEVTQRGTVVHRALARFHDEPGGKSLPEATDELVRAIEQAFDRAVREEAERTPTRAGQRLWQLEGLRLKRMANRYPEQWQKFVAAWNRKHGADRPAPQPRYLELDFGPDHDGKPSERGFATLTLGDAGTEVRLRGRIDRVDIVDEDGEIGFWVIDYKTGGTSKYPSKAVLELERLQPTLYSLAIEEGLLADRNARPFGVAYWFLDDKRGPSVTWLDAEQWGEIKTALREWVTQLVLAIRAGDFSLRPRSDKCTESCHFGQVCRISQSRDTKKPTAVELPLAGDK